MELLMLAWGCVLLQAAPTFAGCYERRLCCPGRNLSCVSINERADAASTDTNDGHIVGREEQALGGKINGWHLHLEPNTRLAEGYDLDDFYQSLAKTQKLANLIEIRPSQMNKPPPVAFVEEFLPPPEEEPSAPEVEGSGSWHKVTNLGSSYDLAPDGVDFSARPHSVRELDPIIRYAIFSNPYHALHFGSEKLGNMELPGDPNAKVCYCDEVCKRLGDCCDDYHSLCPVTDCEFSGWSGWGSCETKSANELEPDAHSRCGPGFSYRYRQVVREAAHGGEPCPHLQEEKACFKTDQCTALTSDVSLLLPYKYSEVRLPGLKNALYYDLPQSLSKLNTMSDSCIIFDVLYLAYGCTEADYATVLRPGSSICAECQPLAQLRPNDTCVGEGVEGVTTIFTAADTKFCSGLWTRRQRRKPCTCKKDYHAYPAFILV